MPIMIFQADILKCLVLSTQQCKTYEYSVYNDIKQRKAANPYTGGTKLEEDLCFVWKTTETSDQLSK